MTNPPRNDLQGSGPSLADLRREGDGASDLPVHPCESLDGPAWHLVPEGILDETVVKDNLDAILLALVETSDGETHGKALMNRLGGMFGVHLSPGTLYPRLHALEESGLLRVQERVRTKEYKLADAEAAYDLIERRSRQQLTLGRLLRDALVVESDAEPDDD